MTLIRQLAETLFGRRHDWSEWVAQPGQSACVCHNEVGKRIEYRICKVHGEIERRET